MTVRDLLDEGRALERQFQECGGFDRTRRSLEGTEDLRRQPEINIYLRNSPRSTHERTSQRVVAVCKDSRQETKDRWLIAPDGISALTCFICPR